MGDVGQWHSEESVRCIQKAKLCRKVRTVLPCSIKKHSFLSLLYFQLLDTQRPVSRESHVKAKHNPSDYKSYSAFMMLNTTTTDTTAAAAAAAATTITTTFDNNNGWLFYSEEKSAHLYTPFMQI